MFQLKGELLDIKIKDMVITVETKQSILKSFQKHESDTGSSEVQIALLTQRITDLTAHLKLHTKDAHSRRGLIALANRRRKLLEYLKSNDFEKYQDVINRLGLRH
jgi:small subunit ribosomal protein S15